jgi:hypothetical protein
VTDPRPLREGEVFHKEDTRPLPTGPAEPAVSSDEAVEIRPFSFLDDDRGFKDFRPVAEDASEVQEVEEVLTGPKDLSVPASVSFLDLVPEIEPRSPGSSASSEPTTPKESVSPDAGKANGLPKAPVLSGPTS